MMQKLNKDTKAVGRGTHSDGKTTFHSAGVEDTMPTLKGTIGNLKIAASKAIVLFCVTMERIQSA